MCVLSCYNWNNTTNAGPWACNLNNYRTNSNNNVGFRCDCASTSNSAKKEWSTGIDCPGLAEIVTNAPFLVGQPNVTGMYFETSWKFI